MEEQARQFEIREWYSSYRPYLAAVAYRMLGSFTESEDVVQDVFIRLHDLSLRHIREPKSYLTKMTVTRCIDILRSARKQREIYVGPWLPEPDVRPPQSDNGERMIIEETISYALLVVLEKLTPGERAVFLLYETLDYSYEEVANMLDKTMAACRKTMSRVRRKLQGHIPESTVADDPRGSELTMRFLRAAQSGEVEHLLAWLADDAVCWSDGGGVVHAAIKPLVGADRVAAFLQGLARKVDGEHVQLVPLLVNGELGVGVMEYEVWTTVIAIEWREDQVQNVFMVRNPHKLKHIDHNL